MPSDWYLMSRPLFNSGFESDEFNLFAHEGFEEVLESFIAQDVEIYNTKLTDTPIVTRAIIQNTTGNILNNAVQRQILCRIGTLKCGQYVKAGKTFWLVCTLPDNNKLFEKAIMWQCKHPIRFISPITGEVAEYPVYDINSTQYGSGETAKSLMTIGAAQRLVYIPYNDETILLDSGFRFLMDKNKKNPTAYRLTQVDSESYACGEDEGVLQWTVVETQRDDTTDNIELMVADYYGKSQYSVPDAPELGYAISLIPENKSAGVTFGENIRIDVRFYEDGVEISPLPFTATIVDGGEYGSIVETGLDFFVVRALKNREFIGHEITAKVVCDTASVTSSLILTVEGWY